MREERAAHRSPRIAKFVAYQTPDGARSQVLSVVDVAGWTRMNANSTFASASTKYAVERMSPPATHGRLDADQRRAC